VKTLLLFLYMSLTGLALLPLNGVHTNRPAVPSFEREVFPLIKAKCNTKDCHNVQRSNPVFTTYDGIKPHAKRILKRIKDRSIPMPPRDSGIVLTQAEIDIIEAWVNAGAPKN